MDWELFSEIFPQLLSAVPTTLKLAFTSVFLGFFIAVAVAVMRLSRNAFAWGVSYSYVYIFRSTPLLVQIFLIYYGAGQFDSQLEQIGLWVFFKDPWFCAILALMLNTGAYTSEIIRGGMESVPFGQIEAGRASGMSKWVLFKRIIFPVAIRQALPGYGNEIILMIKSTSLASTITILDLTLTARISQSETFLPIPTFILAGAFYLTMNFIVTRIVFMAERRLSPYLHRDHKSWIRTILDKDNVSPERARQAR